MILPAEHTTIHYNFANFNLWRTPKVWKNVIQWCWKVRSCGIYRRAVWRVRRFRGTYRFRLHDRIVGQAELASCFCWFLSCSTRPWRWSCYAPVRRAVSELHGVTTQETASFIVTATATINRIYWMKLDSRMLLSIGHSVVAIVAMIRCCTASGIY
jgi:hypothetical protein